MAIPDLLRGCPLFIELYDSEVESIVKDCHVYTFRPGEHIIKAGHEGREIFIILDGSASIQKVNEKGEFIRIQPLKKGDVMGEASLLEERIYQSDVVADSVAAVLEVPYEKVFKRYRTEPRIFAIIMLNLARLFAKRLRWSNKAIADLKKVRENDQDAA